MRVLIVFTFAVFLLTNPSLSSGDEKGALEKAGAAMDRGIEKTKDYFGDSAITSRVKTRLVKDDYVSGFYIKISTKVGACSVSGEVANEKLATRVMEIVRATKGVKSATNGLLIVKKTLSTVR
jgi:osmotically-inducible protein OsmY